MLQVINPAIESLSISEALNKTKEIQELKKEIEDAVAESSQITVLMEDDLLPARHALSKHKNLIKNTDTLRKYIKDPLTQKAKDVQTFFADMMLDSNSEKERLNKEIVDYDERKRKAAAEKARLEREEAEKKAAAIAKAKEEQLKAEAKERGETAEEIESIVVEPAIQAVDVEEVPGSDALKKSGITARKLPRWKVTDISKVPLEYLTVDEKKMNNFRKEFAADAPSPIPGIEFYFDTTTVG